MKLQMGYFKIISLLLLLVVTNGVSAQTDQLVVIDGAFMEKQEVLAKIGPETAILQLSNTGNPWEAIRHELLKDSSIKQIHLFANATYDQLGLGGKVYTLDNLENEWELAMLEGLYQGTNYQLFLYNCNLASNPEGLAFLRERGTRTFFNISAHTQC